MNAEKLNGSCTLAGMPMHRDWSKPQGSKTNFSSHLLVKIGLQIFCQSCQS